MAILTLLTFLPHFFSLSLANKLFQQRFSQNEIWVSLLQRRYGNEGNWQGYKPQETNSAWRYLSWRREQIVTFNSNFLPDGSRGFLKFMKESLDLKLETWIERYCHDGPNKDKVLALYPIHNGLPTCPFYKLRGKTYAIVLN